MIKKYGGLSNEIEFEHHAKGIDCGFGQIFNSNAATSNRDGGGVLALFTGIGAPLFVVASTTGVTVAAATTGIFWPVTGAVAAAGITAGVVMVVRNNKMIRLIDESEAFYLNNGTMPAGRVLRKLHDKINDKNPSLSILDLAKFIDHSNRTKALCFNGSMEYFRHLKNELADGSIQNIDLDFKP